MRSHFNSHHFLFLTALFALVIHCSAGSCEAKSQLKAPSVESIECRANSLLYDLGFLKNPLDAPLLAIRLQESLTALERMKSGLGCMSIATQFWGKLNSALQRCPEAKNAFLPYFRDGSQMKHWTGKALSGLDASSMPAVLEAHILAGERPDSKFMMGWEFAAISRMQMFSDKKLKDIHRIYSSLDIVPSGLFEYGLKNAIDSRIREGSRDSRHFLQSKIEKKEKENPTKPLVSEDRFRQSQHRVF